MVKVTTTLLTWLFYTQHFSCFVLVRIVHGDSHNSRSFAFLFFTFSPKFGCFCESVLVTVRLMLSAIFFSWLSKLHFSIVFYALDLVFHIYSTLLYSEILYISIYLYYLVYTYPQFIMSDLHINFIFISAFSEILPVNI